MVNGGGEGRAADCVRPRRLPHLVLLAPTMAALGRLLARHARGAVHAAGHHRAVANGGSRDGGDAPPYRVVSVDRAGLDAGGLGSGTAWQGGITPPPPADDTPLAKHLRALIQFRGGPLTVAEYMSVGWEGLEGMAWLGRMREPSPRAACQRAPPLPTPARPAAHARPPRFALLPLRKC